MDVSVSESAVSSREREGSVAFIRRRLLRGESFGGDDVFSAAAPVADGSQAATDAATAPSAACADAFVASASGGTSRAPASTSGVTSRPSIASGVSVASNVSAPVGAIGGEAAADSRRASQKQRTFDSDDDDRRRSVRRCRPAVSSECCSTTDTSLRYTRTVCAQEIDDSDASPTRVRERYSQSLLNRSHDPLRRSSSAHRSQRYIRNPLYKVRFCVFNA